MDNTVDIIIPTFNNFDQLGQCVRSVLRTTNFHPCRIIVVNNSKVDLTPYVPQHSSITITTPGENLGWTGGLAHGLRLSSSKYVMFLNDDTYIPRSSVSWLRDMVMSLESRSIIGAIGPSSNCVSGVQNIWYEDDSDLVEVPFLIGFCKLVRRSALDEIGGIDLNWEHGDDFDISIRLRKKGYALVCRRDVFVFHHGFQTGTKVHGEAGTAGGWNSPKQIERTNTHIIKEHGFLAFWETVTGRNDQILVGETADAEGEFLRSFVNGHSPDDILDIGCGDNVTVIGSFGVDRKLDGSDLNNGLDAKGKRFKLIIARHILEHLRDPQERIQEWLNALEHKGELFIVCPNEETCYTIGLDPTHIHGFTKSFLKFIIESQGGKVEFLEGPTDKNIHIKATI